MSEKALLIIDMSNDFVHDKGTLTAGARAQAISNEIIKKANGFIEDGAHIFICMDAHEENDAHFDLWPAHNVKGTWGQDLYDPLQKWYDEHKELANVHYLSKTEYDAFHETTLKQQLIDLGVKKVYLTGVCTDICVFLTAYGAYKNGFETVVYKKGTATFTENQEAFLQQMKTVFLTEIE